MATSDLHRNGNYWNVYIDYSVNRSNGVCSISGSIKAQNFTGNTFMVRNLYVSIGNTNVASGKSANVGSYSTSTLCSFSGICTNNSHSSAYNSISGSFTGIIDTVATWEGCSFTSGISVPEKSSYSVSYNANGGSGAPGGQTKWYNETLSLSSTKPSRSGYVFKCWNTNSSGTGTNYNPGANYTSNANLTLYAIWYQNYTVSYNANGGTGAPSAQTKVYNTNLTLSWTKPTRTGYVFKCWNTNTSNTGTSYSPGGTYSANANLTLYAIWDTTVSYNANGGSGAPSAQTKLYGTNLTLSSTEPTRTGYVFWHWNTTDSNTGTTYSPGATYSTHSPMTLYAIWNPLIYYNGNGSDAGNLPSTQTKTYGQTATLSSQTPTRPGYEFTGWNTKSDGTGTAYAGGASYADNTTLTLYAQWRRTAYPPTISSMSVVRCNSSGVSDDEGQYFKCTVSWSVDTTSQDVPNNELASLTGSYVPSDGGTAVTWSTWSGTATGTSGTAYAIVGAGLVDTDTQYLVTVAATDGKPQTTTRTDVLTRAFFIIDFKADGSAVGIGSAAPSSGFEVGWPSQFDDDVTVLGDIEAENYKVTSLTQSQSGDIISAAGTWTINSAQAIKCGHLCHVYVSAKNSSALSAGTSSQVGTLAQGWRPRLIATFGCPHGGGYASGSSLYMTPHVSLGANTSVSIGFTFYVDT